MSKDGWNRNIENLVQAVNETDWQEVRGLIERKLVGVAGSVTEAVKENVPSLKEVSAVQKREG